MKIVAKCSLVEEQIQDKINRGFNDFELQMIDEFFYDKMIDVNKELEKIKKLGVNVVSIHMPFIDETGEAINLQFFTHERYEKIFFKVCELAQRCAETFNHKVYIIIHNDFNMSIYERIPKLLSDIVSLFKNVHQVYKDALFSIENVTPFQFNEKINELSTRNGAFAENAELAKYLNYELNDNLFGTTIDICHIIMTRLAFEYLKIEPIYKEMQLEDYFKLNKGVNFSIDRKSVV